MIFHPFGTLDPGFWGLKSWISEFIKNTSVTDNLHGRYVYVLKIYSFGVIYVIVIAFILQIRTFENICGTKKGNEKDFRGESAHEF